MKSTRLSRLRDALRARDWLGIGIELAVVVVGILIAFQIDQWGDERQRASDEQHLLERLYTENRRAIREMEEVIPQHQKAYREIGAALRAADDPARLALYARASRFGCGIGNFPYAPHNDTSSQELVTSGRLSLVSDSSLRDLIREVVALQNQVSQRVAQGRTFTTITYPATAPHYRFTLGERPDSMCTIAWDGLMQDPQAKPVAYSAYRVQQTVLRARVETLAAEHRLERALACKLGKPECKR